MSECRNNICGTCRPCCSIRWCRIFRREATAGFTVTYEANGGIGNYQDTALEAGTQYTVKSIAETGITRSGFTFDGWNTEADGGGTGYQPGETINISEDVTLYAQWTAVPPQTFSVTYAPNGGTGGTTDSDIAAGTQYSVKTNTEANVTRSGFTFDGWNTEAGGGGTEYQPGETINISEDVTLYAQWTQ